MLVDRGTQYLYLGPNAVRRHVTDELFFGVEVIVNTGFAHVGTGGDLGDFKLRDASVEQLGPGGFQDATSPIRPAAVSAILPGAALGVPVAQDCTQLSASLN